MRRPPFGEEQIIGVLKEAEAGMKSAGACRRPWDRGAVFVPLERQGWGVWKSTTPSGSDTGKTRIGVSRSSWHT